MTRKPVTVKLHFMKRIVAQFFLLSFFLLLSFSSFSRSFYDLNTIYQKAVDYSLEVRLSEAEVEQARARYLESLGQFLPKVDLRAAEYLQDASQQSGGSSFSNSFLRSSQPEVSLTLDVPLFEGLKKFSAFRLARADKRLRKIQLKNTKRLLFLDVSQAFYTVMQIELAISRLSEVLAIQRQRLEELNERVFLGKSRMSERVMQEVDYHLLVADLEELQGQKQVAYEMLSFYTGLRPHPAIQRTQLKHLKWGLSVYLNAINEHPLYLAAKEEVALQKGAKNVVRSELLPRVDLQSNYYPYRTGYREDIKWDVTVSLTAPLLDIEDWGSLKSAKIELEKSKIRLLQTRRQLNTEIRQAYLSYQSANKKWKKYDHTVATAIRNYDLVHKDYLNGLVDNLEVLQAQQRWLEAMQSRDEAYVETRLKWVNLQATAGVLP